MTFVPFLLATIQLTPAYTFHFVGEGGKLYFASISESGKFQSELIPGFFGEDGKLVHCDLTSAVYRTEKESKLSVNGEIVKSIPIVSEAECVGFDGFSILTKIRGQVYKDSSVILDDGADVLRMGFDYKGGHYIFKSHAKGTRLTWRYLTMTGGSNNYELITVWSQPNYLVFLSKRDKWSEVSVLNHNYVSRTNSLPASFVPVTTPTVPGTPKGEWRMTVGRAAGNRLSFCSGNAEKTTLDILNTELQLDQHTEFQEQFEIAWAESATRFIGIHITSKNFGNDLVEYNDGKIKKLQSNVYRIVGTYHYTVE